MKTIHFTLEENIMPHKSDGNKPHKGKVYRKKEPMKKDLSDLLERPKVTPPKSQIKKDTKVKISKNNFRTIQYIFLSAYK